ncbi:PH domain-containing protein [Kitasatospora sp. NPDC097643]|uniref:PH domain-containing protein n=1 Tax=Kitasatospora sp. NPDC097643 TaxID=3157230 RepID=UPI003332A107
METFGFTLSRHQRRRTEVPAAVMTVVLLGPPWFLHWQLGVLLAGLWLPPVLVTAAALYGSTGLTPHGLHLRGPVRHRFVPWEQVTAVTAERRTVKGGPCKVALAHRAAARPLPLPGLRAYESERVEWQDFEVRPHTVRTRWRSASTM